MKIVERNRYEGNDVIETRTLTFEPYPYDEIESVIKKIQNNLSKDLLKGKRLKYATDVQKYKYYGHCYHSSQALFFMMDTDKLVPMSAVDWRDEKHWWLQDGNNIYDATEEQYYIRAKVPPHSKGKKSNWYGWKQRPQVITFELMKKVLTDRLVSDTISTGGMAR
tara:strand:- start:186 stop:680 length:495 start_codon:yes stop_codon:yes gene_type:complete